MRRAASLLPALILLAWGVAFGVRALGGGPLAFDDHPGQLARLLHLLDAGPAPWAWHAGWWAGYPELQFYPPGWFYAGGVLWSLTLGTAPAATIYQAMLWLTWLAPGVAAYGFLQRLAGDGWRALPGSLLVLTFTGDPAGGSPSGVEGGVHIGMVAARLAWALLALLAWSVARWAPEPARVPSGAALVFAAIVIVHPSHAPAALAILAGAAVTTRARTHALRQVGLAALVGLLLVAFWMVPLVWHLAETRALAWGALSLGALVTPFGLVLLALIVVALPWRDARALVAALGLGAFAVALDALVAEPLGVRFLPADRVADGVWMLVLLTAGAGLARVALVARTCAPAPVVAALTTVVIVAASLPTAALSLWPRESWPTLTELDRGLRLDHLAAALRAVPPGRVLFVRSAVPLVWGEAWYRPHSHVTALTPAHAGRDILGGTFTHGAPVAAYTYRGDAGPAPIGRLAEQLDGVSLLGRPLETLVAADFERLAERFCVSAIVALEDDAPRLVALGEAPHVRRVAVPPFVVYVVPAPEPPQRRARDRWRVTVRGGGWVSTGTAFYPLWRASQDGAVIPIRRGADGALEVSATRSGEIDLVYGPGWVELVGLGISLATAAGIAADAWRRRRAAPA